VSYAHYCVNHLSLMVTHGKFAVDDKRKGKCTGGSQTRYIYFTGCFVAKFNVTKSNLHLNSDNNLLTIICLQ
jgi:hypothetical protein